MGEIAFENQADWHALRRKTVGGSEVAALFNCSPYLTLNELYHLKRGNLRDGHDNPFTRFGKRMEPIIAELVEDEMGWRLRQRDVHLYHDDHPCLGATLD